MFSLRGAGGQAGYDGYERRLFAFVEDSLGSDALKAMWSGDEELPVSFVNVSGSEMWEWVRLAVRGGPEVESATNRNLLARSSQYAGAILVLAGLAAWIATRRQVA